MSGRKTRSAVARTTSSIVARPSDEAVMSRKQNLVGPLGVVGGGDRHGIAGVAQLLELNAFFDPPAVDVEAGDDPLAQHA